MRYFKCDDPLETTGLKARYAELEEQEKRTYLRNKLQSRLGIAVFILVTALLLIGGYFLMDAWFAMESDGILLKILQFAFGVALVICVVIAAPSLGMLASVPFYGKSDDAAKAARKQLLSQSCAHLREYYGFREPFVVTKCFDSSDRSFKNHDICLFFVDGELRLTANLHYGFFEPSRDLGCYAFQKEEITVTQVPREQHFATELTAGEVTFLLGSRAGSFIEANIDHLG